MKDPTGSFSFASKGETPMKNNATRTICSEGIAMVMPGE
jgi:hypothetical protein